MAPRFHLFVSDVDQRNEGARWVQDYPVWLERWKGSPKILCKLPKIKGFGTAWNLCMACGLLRLNPEAVRGASHQLASMDSFLTISQVWYPCLTSSR